MDVRQHPHLEAFDGGLGIRSRIAENLGGELAKLGDEAVVLDQVRGEAGVGVQPHEVLLRQEVGVGEGLQLVHQHDDLGAVLVGQSFLERADHLQLERVLVVHGVDSARCVGAHLAGWHRSLLSSVDL
jgi:hypothetical protein